MNNSKIEWCDHTWNPWWGCMKVSAGCKNCYAEAINNRWKGGHWGPGSTRKPQSEEYWELPWKWNKAAAIAGKPAKVFCASMGDIFEGHPDTFPHLRRLFRIIERTPHLIWQLLTKRPENILELIPRYWLSTGIPDNIWFGTSVENQEAGDLRIPHLLRVPAKVRFLSCEPLIGHIRLQGSQQGDIYYRNWLNGSAEDPNGKIHWVIAGGESGRNARPCHPDWVRSIRDQCQASEVHFFFKQWGEWYTGYRLMPTDEPTFKMYRDYQHFANKDWVNKGDACISVDGRLCKIGQDFMQCAYPVAIMQRIGKSKSGRLLDGREWNEFPNY